VLDLGLSVDAQNALENLLDARHVFSHGGAAPDRNATLLHFHCWQSAVSLTALRIALSEGTRIVPPKIGKRK
jgi:hypothetical protein